MARIVQLIYTREYRGDGTEADPCRRIPQLWTLDGKLVAQEDVVDRKQSLVNLETNLTAEGE
jgi:hypothetical protein